MTYKTVILDDEPAVTRWLTEKIDWQEWNCEIVGVGKNGLEGRALVEAHRPNLIVSDVRMPGLNGLELSQYVQEHHPRTVVLMLSGFNEFEYVRTAMRNNVFDYLLKPIDIGEFRMTMDKVLAHLQQLSDSERSHEISEQTREESSRLTESGILMRLMLNGNQELDAILATMRRLGLEINRGQVAVFELQQIPQEDKWKPVYQYAVKNILHETFERSQCHAQVLSVDGRTVVVCKFTPDIPISVWEDRVLAAAREGLENVKLYLKCAMSLGIGPAFRTIMEFHAAHQMALDSLDKQTFWAYDTVPAAGGSIAGPSESPFALDPVLYDYIEQGDASAAEEYMRALALRLRRTSNVEFAQSVSTEMLIRLSKIAEKWAKELDFPFLVNSIRQYRSFDELMNAVTTAILSVCRWIADKKAFTSASLTDKVTLYIRERYNDPNLHMSGVAAAFHVSLSHLSRLFVKATGMNFNEYLTEIRLEHAKRLMEKEYWLSNQEIAERIGFSDGRYFSQVFKKYCGKTPNEHRGKKVSP